MSRAPGDARLSAQNRADRIRAFREELQQLESEQALTLSDDQRSRLTQHHDALLSQLAQTFDVDVSASQKQVSLGMKIASALGGLALCAAVFLFFYRFWGYLATPVQIAILVAAPVAGIAAMEFTARRERTLYFTALIGVITIAAFVLNLFVLGELFNIPPSPNAFLVWGAFAMVLAYTFRMRWFLALGVAGITVWMAGVLTDYAGWSWTSEFSHAENYLVPAALCVVIGAVRDDGHFSPVYRLCGWIFGFLAMLVVSAGGQSLLPWSRDAIRQFYQAAGMVVAALAIWIGVKKQWTGTVNTGAVFFVIYLLLRLVDWWWDTLPKYVFFFIVGAIAIGLLAFFKRIRDRMVRA